MQAFCFCVFTFELSLLKNTIAVVPLAKVPMYRQIIFTLAWYVEKTVYIEISVLIVVGSKIMYR